MAVFSDCGQYRYTLWRESLLSTAPVLFVMLNPSTADATEDDPTIRRCRGFVSSWGYGGVSVANLYAYRATDPRRLHEVDDPVGPDNDDWIARLALGAGLIVAAWGANPGPIPKRPEQVLKLLKPFDVVALALTQDGHPRHPLYVRGDVEPESYPPSVS